MMLASKVSLIIQFHLYKIYKRFPKAPRRKNFIRTRNSNNSDKNQEIFFNRGSQENITRYIDF